MNITVISVGKIKEKYFTAAIDEYSKRLSRFAKLNIIEVADEKIPDNASEKEMEQIKEKEGNKIIKSIEENLGLKFNEEEVKIDICEGYQDKGNFSGSSIKDNMVFRYNNRCKCGTFYHELSHRIITEYDMFEKLKEKFNLKDEHQIFDLFLYDAIEETYGAEAALFRVEYEKTFPESEFKESWDYALSMNKEERKNILKEMVNVVK